MICHNNVESIPLVYFETLCLTRTEYLYRKIRAELIPRMCFYNSMKYCKQESSAEQVSQRSSFVCAGAAAYLCGQQDEMIPMPTWTKALYIDPFWSNWAFWIYLKIWPFWTPTYIHGYTPMCAKQGKKACLPPSKLSNKWPRKHDFSDSVIEGPKNGKVQAGFRVILGGMSKWHVIKPHFMTINHVYNL